MYRRKSGASAISRCRFWSVTTSSPRSISRPIAKTGNCCCRNGIGLAPARRRARARISSAGSRRSCIVSSGFSSRSEGCCEHDRRIGEQIDAPCSSAERQPNSSSQRACACLTWLKSSFGSGAGMEASLPREPPYETPVRPSRHKKKIRGRTSCPPPPVAALRAAAKERTRDLDDPRDLVAPHSVSGAGVFLFLSRPRQSRLRRADHECRAEILPDHFRLGRRHLLHRLFHFRGAEQSGAGEIRRQPLDRAHHGDLGHHLRVDGAGVGRLELLLPALPAWRRRSRIFPGHHSLSDLLVPGGISRAFSRRLRHRRSRVLRDRRADLGPAARARWRDGAERLAMAVHHRGHSLRPARHRHLVLSHRPAGKGRLADV